MKLTNYKMHFLWGLLLTILALCLLSMVGGAPCRADENSWAIPSGPLPEPPPPGDPIPDGPVGNYTNDGNTSEPTPAPNPTPAPAPNPAPAPAPAAPTVDPQQQFQQQKEILLKEFHMPAALVDDSPAPAATTSSANIDNGFATGTVPMGLSDSEWKEASQCQQALDALYAKWPLSSTEANELVKLEARRNQLWVKAISIPGLTADERDRLRLKMHVLNPPPGKTIPTVSKETVDKWLKPPALPTQSQEKPAPPAINPVATWLVGQFALGQAQSAAETGGEEWADHILEEHSYGDFLGVSKIALAYKEGGVSSALTETMNYLVGKIPIPQASMAVEGGRQYANIVFQAENKFMTDAMKAAGGEFDKEKFWSDFNDDCNAGQKAVKEWIGYGTE